MGETHRDLPDLDDILDTARVVALPMATRFRGITMREALVFEGTRGWSEFSPFVEYGDEEAAAWLEGAIDFAFTPVGETHRDEIRVNATIPAVPATEVAGVLARFPGCRTAKVKVADPGQTLDDDVARVKAARAFLGPEGRIRVDANGLWNLDQAERAIHALAPFDLEYAEQPCATVAELAEIRRRTKHLGVPIAADESVRKAADPLAVAREGTADVIIVKAQPLRGIHRALSIMAQTGLPAVVSSAIDTSIGLSMGAFLAARLPELAYDCGLGTSALFIDDITDYPLTPRNGAIDVRRITPDPHRLDALAADGERTRWWLDRLTRCHALLATRA